MKMISKICIDAGTVNCPCPLAETGNCLVCSRLSGKDKCDCSWCGLCIYNEFVQNDKKARNKRCDVPVKILSKKWYSDDLVVMEIKVPRGFALEGTRPGSFVFLNGTKDPFFNVPVSIMRVDVERSTMSFAVKVFSAKTKALVNAKDSVFVRGIYRSGLLGKGVSDVILPKSTNDLKATARWLFMTKGVGFAPAVNIVDRLTTGITADMVIDTEKITEEIVVDSFSQCDAVKEGRVRMDIIPFNRIIDRKADDVLSCLGTMKSYDKVFVLASDHFIRTLSAALNVSERKLIYSNNFNMCCGEGVCGACCHVDENGTVTKMCKCKEA